MTEMPDAQNNTPLHYAAKGGQLEACKLLISKGALVGVRNKQNKTPYDLSNSMYVRQYLLPIQLQAQTVQETANGTLPFGIDRTAPTGGVAPPPTFTGPPPTGPGIYGNNYVPPPTDPSRVIRSDGFHSSASDPTLQAKYGHKSVQSVALYNQTTPSGTATAPPPPPPPPPPSPPPPLQAASSPGGTIPSVPSPAPPAPGGYQYQGHHQTFKTASSKYPVYNAVNDSVEPPPIYHANNNHQQQHKPYPQMTTHQQSSAALPGQFQQFHQPASFQHQPQQFQQQTLAPQPTPYNQIPPPSPTPPTSVTQHHTTAGASPHPAPMQNPASPVSPPPPTIPVSSPPKPGGPQTIMPPPSAAASSLSSSGSLSSSSTTSPPKSQSVTMPPPPFSNMPPPPLSNLNTQKLQNNVLQTQVFNPAEEMETVQLDSGGSALM